MNDKAVEVANNAIEHMPNITSQMKSIAELMGHVQHIRTSVNHLRRDWNAEKMLPDATLHEIEQKLLSLVMVLSGKDEILRMKMEKFLDIEQSDIPF